MRISWHPNGFWSHAQYEFYKHVLMNILHYLYKHFKKEMDE